MAAKVSSSAQPRLMYSRLSTLTSKVRSVNDTPIAVETIIRARWSSSVTVANGACRPGGTMVAASTADIVAGLRTQKKGQLLNSASCNKAGDEAFQHILSASHGERTWVRKGNAQEAYACPQSTLSWHIASSPRRL